MTADNDDQVELEDPSLRPGVPDAFERMVYISGENKPPSGDADVCPFCNIPDSEDAEGLIVHRGKLAYAVLNLYPYAPGHLLICPYRHVADYPDLTDPELSEVAHLTQRAMTVLRIASGPHGFNLGINQGAVAGAGIAAHLHQHVVPRWSGDANFLPVIGQTRALPQLLGQTWEIVRRVWNEQP